MRLKPIKYAESVRFPGWAMTVIVGALRRDAAANRKIQGTEEDKFNSAKDVASDDEHIANILGSLECDGGFVIYPVGDVVPGESSDNGQYTGDA